MNRFILFGQEHLTALVVGSIIFFVILILAYFMNKKNRINFIKFLSFIVLIIKILETFYRYYNGENYIALLPLHLCNLSFILAIFTIFTKKTSFFQPLYFWGGGAIFALVTPELKYGFTDFFSVSFFIVHFFIILVIVYLMIFFRFRPTKLGVISSFLLINILALGIFFINKELGTNYLYINRIPISSTLLDVLGPWPYYIISVELIYLFISFILYYPFRGKRLRFSNL